MEKKVYRIDLDGTLFDTKGKDYFNAKPIQKNIDLVNKWFKEGHYIVLWSSRGVGRNIDLREQTVKQLFEANVDYHELNLDKPYFDAFFDDKVFNAKDMETYDLEQQNEEILDFQI